MKNKLKNNIYNYSVVGQLDRHEQSKDHLLNTKGHHGKKLRVPSHGQL